MRTPGPWKWERTKVGDTWHVALRGGPNKWNDTLVTAMREDLAQFPYATETPNAKIIAASIAMYEALQNYIEVQDRLRQLWVDRHKEGTNYTETLIKEGFPAYEQLKAALAQADAQVEGD
jgi:hypothetical protein